MNASWSWPITDESIYPTMSGSYKDGYGARVYPGLGGYVRTWLLHRGTTVENTTTHDEHVVEWIQVECDLQLRNVNNESVPGSSLGLPWPFPLHTPGDVTTFPVNDAATYPTLTGTYAAGYPITVTPGDIAPTSATIDFAVSASGEFDPATFEIGGNTYSVGCGNLGVDIDIKPGSYPNAINLGSYGLVPVAILSSADFDATSVDPGTVGLAGAGVELRGKSNKLMAHQEDVNADGLVDLVLQVATQNLDSGSFQDGYAILTGSTYAGQAIEGSDQITIVPPE